MKQSQKRRSSKGMRRKSKKDAKTFKNKASLSLIERKYCSCIMTVRGNHFKKKLKSLKKARKSDILNPYGICNNSVLKRRTDSKKKRPNCSVNYNFNSYPIEYLQAYSLEKDLPILNRKNKPLSKSRLLNNIKNKLAQKYNT